MKLTKLDLARLRTFQRARHRAPTAFSLLWRIKPLVLMLGILGAVVFLIPVPSPYKCFVLGFMAGGLFCIFVVAFKFPRTWPLTREILKWDRIEELLKENDMA